MWYRNVKLRDVAVVVYVQNDEDDLDDCLRSLIEASHGEAEIIVVNDGSTDGSREILEKYKSSIQILDGEGKGPGHARNLALQKTRREWLAYTDGDCRVDPNWLIKLCEAMDGQANSLAGAGGVLRISRKASAMERRIGEFLELFDFFSKSNEPRFVRHNSTRNILYARDALELVSGFDEDVRPCEGLDLDLRLARLGSRALFQPEAVVEQRRPRSAAALGRYMRDYGYGYAQLLKKHGLTEKIQWLAILSPFFAFSFYAIFWRYGIRLATLSVLSLFAFTILLFSLRTFSLLKGIVFTYFLNASYTLWLFGFYTGLFKKRRIF